MFQTIIKDIIGHTHFSEARERAQYIVEEMEKARVKMEGYARETDTTARRTALIPILKSNEEAVRQAKKRAVAWDMECEQRQVERWLQERLEKEIEGELSRPWRGGLEAMKKRMGQTRVRNLSERHKDRTEERIARLFSSLERT